MAGRIYQDWLKQYVDLRCENTEAPAHVHFWSGVSAIAGALKRKVWIDQINFKWYPNFYIIIVAEPAVIQKSTTAELAIGLLKRLPSTRMGPDAITWPALFSKLEECCEGVFDEATGNITFMSALTVCASELGNLLDPDDRQLMDALITLWDGKDLTEKVTKTQGENAVEGAWINIIGCTTPKWIARYVPLTMVGGGLTSRIVWVHAFKKTRKVAYPRNWVRPNHAKVLDNLTSDLEAMSKLKGEYLLTAGAEELGNEWYEDLWDNRAANPLYVGDNAGVFPRLQTQAHKLAMVIAASRRDELTITADDLEAAIDAVVRTALESQETFSMIGAPDLARYRRMIWEYLLRAGPMEKDVLFQKMANYLPRNADFTDMIISLQAAGQIEQSLRGNAIWIVPKLPAQSQDEPDRATLP